MITFRALVVLELIDSDEEKEKERDGSGKTRNLIKKREELGYYANIVRELRMEDTDGWKEMMRMDFEYFKEILILIEPDITPQEIVGGNKAILAAESSTLTIRFLATGKCNAIVKYLRVPSTEEEWLSIAE